MSGCTVHSQLIKSTSAHTHTQTERKKIKKKERGKRRRRGQWKCAMSSALPDCDAIPHEHQSEEIYSTTAWPPKTLLLTHLNDQQALFPWLQSLERTSSKRRTTDFDKSFPRLLPPPFISPSPRQADYRPYTFPRPHNATRMYVITLTLSPWYYNPPSYIIIHMLRYKARCEGTYMSGLHDGMFL